MRHTMIIKVSSLMNTPFKWSVIKYGHWLLCVYQPSHSEWSLVKFVTTVASHHHCICMKGCCLWQFMAIGFQWMLMTPVSLSVLLSPRWMLTETFFSPHWRWTMRWCRPTWAAASVTRETPSCPLTAPECSSASPWVHGMGSATTRWTAAPCAVGPTAG